MPGPLNPAVLAFDVNETILDITVLEPLFERLFGRRDSLREWYAQLILHSQSLTLADTYVPLDALGAGVLRMVASVGGIALADDDVAELGAAVRTLPPHADAAPALERLRAAGFRLVTLTNSPPDPEGGPLARAGLASLFERQFSVDAVKRYKPAPETYRLVAETLGVRPVEICLVAAHHWDLVGARGFGASTALVLRSGNAALPCPGVPQPDLVVSDFAALADALTQKR